MENLSRRYLAPLVAVAALAGGASCEREPAKDQNIPAVQTDTYTSVVEGMSEYARLDAKQAAVVVAEQRQRAEQEYASRRAANLKAYPPTLSDGPHWIIDL